MFTDPISEKNVGSRYHLTKLTHASKNELCWKTLTFKIQVSFYSVMLTDLKSARMSCRNKFPPLKADPQLREVTRINVDFQNSGCNLLSYANWSQIGKNIWSERIPSHPEKPTHTLNGGIGTNMIFQNSVVNLRIYAQCSQIGKNSYRNAFPTSKLTHISGK